MSHPPPDAVLFDLDGVITRTAKVHRAAWQRTFDSFLAARGASAGEDLRPFSAEDYRAYVDGRPRLDGVRAFLASRRIALAEGAPADPPAAPTVHGLARQKNLTFQELLPRVGVDVDPAATSVLSALRAAGVRVGLCTSSRNAAAVLRLAGLEDQLDARVDGVVSAELGLAGKPAPDIFLTCARLLEARPDKSVVVEDAAAGVTAGRAGGFGLVVGVDTGKNAARLDDAGADWIVSDLAPLSPAALAERMATRARGASS